MGSRCLPKEKLSLRRQWRGLDPDKMTIRCFEMFGLGLQFRTDTAAQVWDYEPSRDAFANFGEFNFSDANACFRIGYQDVNSESKQSPADSYTSAHGKEFCARGDWRRKSRRQTEFRSLCRSVYVGSGHMSLICRRTIQETEKIAKSSSCVGGARRNRTDDLFNAIEALSQLSYGPIFRTPRCAALERSRLGPASRERAARIDAKTARSQGPRGDFSSARPAPARRAYGSSSSRYRRRSGRRRRRRPLPLLRGRCRRPRSSSSTSMSSSAAPAAFSSPASASSSETSSTPAGATASSSSSSSFGARALRARGVALEHRSAFGADDRILVQIEEFGAAVLALALGSELGFRHLLGIPALGD